MIKKSLFLIIFLILFSCSSNTNTQKGGKIIIRLWHPFAATSQLGKTLQKMVDEFNSKNPQWFVKPEGMGSYSVLKQKLLAAIIAGNQPEMSLAYESWISKLYAGKKLAIFDEEFNKDEITEIKNDLFNVFIQSCTVDNKLVALPFNKSMPVLYYNRDLFEKYKIKKTPETWEEFIEIAKKLTVDTNNDGKIDIYGTISRINLTDFLNFLKQNGGEIISEDGKELLYNKQEGIEALKFFFMWKYIYRIADFYVSGNPYEYQNDFSKGKCAMIIGSCVSRYFMIYSLKFRLGTAPIFGHKKKAVNVYGTNIVIFKDATPEQKKAAFEFIKYFISPENTAKWSRETGYMPVRKSALKSKYLIEEFQKDPGLKSAILQLDYGFLEPPDENWLLGREYISEAINNAYIDKEIQKKYEEYLNILNVKTNQTAIEKKEKELEETIEKRIKFHLDKSAEKLKRWILM